LQGLVGAFLEFDCCKYERCIARVFEIVDQELALGPGYQVPYAQRVKAEVGLPTIAVGLITEPEQAEAIIANNEADAVSLARAMLYDPRWPWHAAARLGAQVAAPKQYWRSQPREYKDLFENARTGQR
jgi:2,4-dienoyl-CoA reductase-like NADH-dependent reductase (Old Yellow Enzyme family)